MRVLMLTHNQMGLGGSYARAFAIARALAAIGHQITLVASRRLPGLRPHVDLIDGVRLIQCADIFPSEMRHGGLSPMDILGRLGIVARGNIDIIHALDHRPAVAIPALVGRRWRGIPFVSDWADLWGKQGIANHRHGLAGHLIGQFDDFLEDRLHAQADAVTAITKSLTERAQQLGIPAERIRLVQVGANSDLIKPLPKQEMRRKLGLPVDVPIAVHIGFSNYDEELLAQTFIRVAAQSPRCLLVMAGSRLPLLDALVREARLSQQIRHFGTVPYEQLPEILSCGDLMLLPYSQRAVNLGRFPNRFGDYLAAGRPIVTNRTGELGQLVELENIGIATEDNPVAYAQGILHLFDQPALCDAMAQRARHLAETRLSWTRIAEEIDSLYRILSETRV
jgi:glycosyltransferase involved in cell wall biosynthesis